MQSGERVVGESEGRVIVKESWKVITTEFFKEKECKIKRKLFLITCFITNLNQENKMKQFLLFLQIIIIYTYFFHNKI